MEKNEENRKINQYSSEECSLKSYRAITKDIIKNFKDKIRFIT